MLSVLSALLVATVSLAEPPRSRAPIAPERIDAMLTAPERHVRGLSPSVTSLLEAGARRSYTFARLLDSVERSDVIVYVQAAPDLPLSLAGRLMLAGSAHGRRYLRIQIAPGGTQEDMIATIGHELQHAVEVAESPEVHDDHGLSALYQRIGMGGTDSTHFDTIAAREAGRTIRGELAG